MLAIKSKSLARVVRRQILYLVTALGVLAFFWSVGEQVSYVTVLVYTFCFSNLVAPFVNRLSHLYDQRPSPYNWLMFFPVLIGVSLPAYAITAAIIWWIAPRPAQTFLNFLMTGWKFPALLVLVFGTLRFLYESKQDRWEQRNIKLQQMVEVGAARIEMQEQELRRAREIQESLLPKDIPQLPGFELAGTWLPARAVGGDYFDVLRLGDNRLAMCIADVVGKGVSAALLMAHVQASVRALARGPESPAELCGQLNRVLCENLAPGKFVTFFYGVLDREAHTFRYCNAGHPYPILVSSGSLRELNQGGPVLGVFPEARFNEALIHLNSGDRLLLFTDGVSEAPGANGQEFGTKNIAAFAQAHCASSASELMSQLLADVNQFCGAQFQDDATLLTLAVN